MIAFIAGNGSMGMRRQRDLRTLGIEATAYDAWPSKGLTPAQKDAFKASDLVIVSTPPKEHHRVAVWAANAGMPCFTEADVDFVWSPHYPSATPLFCADVQVIMQSPPPVAYTLHVGQHVADWHPGADPAGYYAYRADTSPPRELIPFELIWLTTWLGPVRSSIGLLDRSASGLVVRHSSGALGSIVIDELSRPAIRHFEAVGDGQRHAWDIRYTEDAYLCEMRALVAAVKGEQKWPYSQDQEWANLQVLRTLERGP